MAKKEFKTIRLAQETELLGLMGKQVNESAASHLTDLMADGLRFRMLRGNFRPSKVLLDRLTSEELFVFYCRWNDAIETSTGFQGPLGNRFEFAVVAEDIDFAEKGENTFIPVTVGTCEAEKIQTKYGEFPVFRDALRRPDLLSLSEQELEGVREWIEAGGFTSSRKR